MGVEENSARRDPLEVVEGEDDVVDNGRGKGLWGSKTYGEDAGVGRVGRTRVRETTVEDDEGDRDEKVEEVATTAVGKSGRVG